MKKDVDLSWAYHHMWMREMGQVMFIFGLGSCDFILHLFKDETNFCSLSKLTTSSVLNSKIVHIFNYDAM